MGGVTITVQEVSKPPYVCVVVMRRDGKRVRERYFRDKARAKVVAEQWRIEAGNAGAKAAAEMSDADRRLFLDAREKLAPYGRTLRDALDFYLEHLARTRRSITVDALAAGLLEHKEREGKSPRYLKDLRLRLARFQKEHGSRLAADISADDVNRWLAGLRLGAQSVLHYRRALCLLFNHGKSGGYCAANPAAEALTPKVTGGETGVLTPAEALALLTGASPDIRPAIAIGLFAGVRDAELQRLDWREIDLTAGFIEIRASKAKSARRRLIPVRENLAAWLAPHARPSGPVMPPGFKGRRAMEAARRAASFGRPGSETPEEKAAGITLHPWPHNAMRHSFASYHLAFFKDANALALELGHTNSRIIFEHYRALVREQAAQTYWSLTPAKAEGENIVNIITA